MKRALPLVWLIVLITVPLWLEDQYILHTLIITGIFIIAAMSLNLLLGYTGQLSLGHVAFFGIGAYASALTTLGFSAELPGGFRAEHEPWPAVAGFVVGMLAAGASGYAIGRLSFKVRGAYFVIVTISFAEVTRLVALNWVELTQGPLALTNIPPFTLGGPGLGYLTLWGKIANYYLVLGVGLFAYVIIARLVGSRIGRAMIALKENETARRLGRHRRHALPGAGGRGFRRDRGRRRQPLRALREDHRSRHLPVHLHRDHGDHGGHRRQRDADGADRRWPDLRLPAGDPAPGRCARRAVDHLWRADDRDRLRPAAGHRAGAAALDRPVGAVEAPSRHARRHGEIGRGRVMPAPAEITLSIEHVAVHFDGLVAISDLDFTVREGEIVGLIGPNGAGKTTAFNVFTGFLKPTAGEVRYRGTLLNGLKPHEIAGLGLVRTFQRTSIFQNNSVFENVLTGLHRRGRSTLWDTLLALPRERASEAELAARAREILRVVGIERRAEELAGALPYGEQRLVGIALALAADPTMLLLDEPVSGMNEAESARVMRLVETIRASGVTVLLVEHDMPMVMQVSDRIVVLNSGTIIAEGPPAAIQNNPDVIRAYLGEGRKRA